MLAIVAIKLLLFVLSSGVESLILERPDLRLSGGNNPFEGRIEILHDGEWSRLCFSGWSIEPADVVCRYLGIETGAMSVWTDPPDENDIPKLKGVLVPNQCDSPRDCSNLDETTSNCDIIGVRCNFPGYLGCFDENDFDSSKKCFDINQGIPSRRCYVDIDSCIRYCTSSGLYMYAGVTNGNQCRCQSSTSLQSDQSESNGTCNRDCKRDDSQKCGDYAYIGVYSTSLGACGGTFSSLEGSITSPRFPDQFASDQECEWTITVPSNYEILLSVVMFELDYDRDNDIKIEYREPGALEEVIRLPGSNKIELPYHIEIPANIVEVIFRSEGSQGEGFVINYEGKYMRNVK
ncbi:kremen protein 1-like [Glandiceps talaboti]